MLRLESFRGGSRVLRGGGRGAGSAESSLAFFGVVVGEDRVDGGFGVGLRGSADRGGGHCGGWWGLAEVGLVMERRVGCGVVVVLSSDSGL